MRRRRELALSRQEPTAFGDDLVLVFLDQRAQAASEVPDARFGYTPGEIRSLFEDWGVGRRELYARTEVTLDLAFPLVYGTLFAVFSARLFRKGLWRWALLVPLSGALADLIENFMIAYLAWSYDGHESPLVRAAACFTEVKFVCFVASLLLLLAGGVVGLRRDKTSIQIYASSAPRPSSRRYIV
jgi:hypothetical protein